jgi:hypothetical protein
MYFDVLTLNVRGQPLSEKERRGRPRVRADIYIHEDRFGPLGKVSLLACTQNLHHSSKGALLPLYDVHLEGMATLGLVLRGTEFIDGQPYPQAWHCRPLDGQFVIPWTSCPRSSLDVLI